MQISNESAIRIEKLSKRYQAGAEGEGVLAIDDLSLEIRRGEFFGLLGPNGAGKSTLINALAGLLRFDNGSITVMDHDVTHQFRDARSNLGVVPQELVMDPFFSVIEMLRFQSGYYGLRNNEEWLEKLLRQLDLWGKRNDNMRKLSGGMKRRVLIAQALVHRPAVLVLDEPTAGVDVELRQILWRFVRELHEKGHTIVLTTHYLEEAEQLCDRIAIIDQGRLVALDNKKDLMQRDIGCKLIVQTKMPDSSLPKSMQARILQQEQCELIFNFNKREHSIMQDLDQLRAHGLEIVAVNLERDRLEDVFLRLTKRGQG